MIKKTITQNDYVEMAKKCLNNGAWRRAMHYLTKADTLYPNPLNYKLWKQKNQKHLQSINVSYANLNLGNSK